MSTTSTINQLPPLVGRTVNLRGWCLFELIVFGSDGVMDKYRGTVACRKSIYRDFVVIQIEPGLEWRDEKDWTTRTGWMRDWFCFFSTAEAYPDFRNRPACI